MTHFLNRPIGHPSCSWLPQSTGPYGETGDVEVIGGGGEHWDQTYGLSGHVPCSICVCTVFRSSEVILLRSWKDLQGSG